MHREVEFRALLTGRKKLLKRLNVSQFPTECLTIFRASKTAELGKVRRPTELEDLQLSGQVISVESPCY